MQHGKESGAGYGKKRHGFGETVDGIAPGLPEQKQNGGNQRAGVADSDPPDKVDDGKSPSGGDGDAPNAYALQE